MSIDTMKNEHPKLVAAAICRNGEVITGRRHFECIKIAVQQRNWVTPVTQDEQGFVDENGKFWTRNQSVDIAILAGQIPSTWNTVLTSEDLW